MRAIAGLTTPATGGLAVLKPFDVQRHVPDGYVFTRWLASLPWWTPLPVIAVMAGWPLLAHAQDRYGATEAFGALWRWMPFLVMSGFLFNVLISALAMAIGTLAGAVLGLAQISLRRPVRAPGLVHHAAVPELALAGPALHRAPGLSVRDHPLRCVGPHS